VSTVIVAATPVRGWRFFADLSVRVKILTAVGVAALVAVVVGVAGLQALQKASAAAQLMYTNNVASIKAVGAVQKPALQARIDIASHALAPDTAAKAKYEKAFRTQLDAFDAAVAAYRTTNPAGDPALIDDLSSQWQIYREIALNKQLDNSDGATWPPGWPSATPN
jgi:methyl-accepting chemotaxis protein